MGLFQNLHMTTYLAVGSNSLISDKCVVLVATRITFYLLSFVCFFFFSLGIAIISTSKNYNLGLVQKVLVILHWYRKIAEPTDMSIECISWNSFALKHHYITVGFVNRA